MDGMRWTLLLIIASAAGLSGCGSVDGRQHAWQTTGDVRTFTVNVRAWSYIAPSRLAHVCPLKRSQAVNMLQSADCIELTPDNVVELCPAAKLEKSAGLKAYLVRGVSYNTPAFAVVKYREKTGWLYVYHATSNGEMYIPGERYSVVEMPIVVLLEKKPVQVSCSANVGGDSIWWGVDMSQALVDPI
jgi:hypothetical protein